MYQCMIWQGGGPEPFRFMADPDACICNVPDVSAGRITWIERYTSGGDVGQRFFHDLSTGETKVVPVGPEFRRLGYLSGSNLALLSCERS